MAGLHKTTQAFDLRTADLSADMPLSTAYVHPIPYDPPDASRITIGPVVVEGEWTRVLSGTYEGRSVPGLYLGGLNWTHPALADLDLLVGERAGHLVLYRNKGTATAPDWQFEAANYAGVSTGDWAYPALDERFDKGKDIHIFILPTGVRPGAVLETDDVFRFAGHFMPTLDSQVAVTVTAPSGGQANHVGYFYNPVDDFVVDEPGLWSVDVRVWHDRQCSGGATIPSYPSGDILGSENGRYWFYRGSRYSLGGRQERLYPLRICRWCRRGRARCSRYDSIRHLWDGCRAKVAKGSGNG